MGRDISADELLEIVREVGAELHPARSDADVTLGMSLERELGFDSLGRMELKLRLERSFGIGLPETVLVTAETPGDLLKAALESSKSPAATPDEKAMPATPRRRASAPGQARTLVEVLDWHVESHGDRTHIILAGDGGGEEGLTYGGLRDAALRVAAGLLDRNLPPRSTVGLMLPTGADYFNAFFGVLLAGGIPVPMYPPARVRQIEEHVRRHVGILANAEARLLITTSQIKERVSVLRSLVPALEAVVDPAELSGIETRHRGYAPGPDDIAFLQYTSGSTGDPKGVVLTHANLLANVRAMGKVTGLHSRDVIVSWLPLYHDMGLIGAWFGSLYNAAILVSKSPLSFLSRPQSWLWAMHRHRGTVTAAPNFAYQLCAQKLDDRMLEGLDLSDWRIACNGAEPVSVETLEEFAVRFAPFGFRREALMPVYGLAENSVGLAFPPVGRGFRVERIDRSTFMNTGDARPAPDTAPDPLLFASCGHALPGHEIRIVDAGGRELGERQQGLLQFKGPSSTTGYYRNPEETRRLFDGEWLNSGDYACMIDGEVFITGRVKEVIIRAGRNIYPYELEAAIGKIPGIRKGSVAIFGSVDRDKGVERVIVLAETREKEAEEHTRLRRRIEELSQELIETAPDDIVFVPPRTVPKTSSGKIRRSACRELYERGGRSIMEKARRWDMLRIAIAAARPRLHRALGRMREALYGVYSWSVFGMIGALAWPVSACIRDPGKSWRFNRAAARAHMRLTGIRVVVSGIENLPVDAPYVLVANHASYMDGMALIVALPRPLVFVAKRELSDHPVTRRYLQSLGVEFVERFDLRRGLSDTTRLLERIRTGKPLGFFPEGTFRRPPGLLPFRMGAFVIAAQAGVPVVPAVIHGTRSILGEGRWLPRYGMVSIKIGKPIDPRGADWDDAVALRNAARVEILRDCREPDLVLEAPGPPPSARRQ